LRCLSACVLRSCPPVCFGPVRLCASVLSARDPCGHYERSGRRRGLAECLAHTLARELGVRMAVELADALAARSSSVVALCVVELTPGAVHTEALRAEYQCQVVVEAERSSAAQKAR
jgi:hypothetical protein